MTPRRMGPSSASSAGELARRARRWLGLMPGNDGDANMAGATGLRPLSGPPLWYGPELAARRDWIRPLTAAEIAALEAAVARLDGTGIDIAAIGPQHLQEPALHPLAE